MLNVIKMDLYRMYKSKVTWIVLLIIGILAATCVNTFYREYKYFKSNPEILEEYSGNNPDITMYSTDNNLDTFYLFFYILQNSLGYIVAFFIALFTVLFTGAENSTGFIKNIAGQPAIRHRTILSKCLTVFVFSSIALLDVFIIIVLVSQLLFGYIQFSSYGISDMMIFALTQLLLYAALGMVALCFTELINNQAISMAISAMLSIGVARIITSNLDDFFHLTNFSFNSLLITINKAMLPVPFDLDSYRRSWLVGAVYIVAAAAVSIFSMKKRDI